MDVRSLLVLLQIPGIGPNRLRALVNHFRDPAVVAHASARDLIRIEGIEQKTARTIAGFFRSGGAEQSSRQIEDQLSRLNRVGGRVLTCWDRDYPENLKKIYDPPPLLFLRGSLCEEDRYAIAIVGTRSPGTYGLAVADRFAAGLARLGIPVVSGLARGIDTAAHSAVVRARGRTLAVIGSGIDVIYPPENRNLVERLVASGALLSEYPIGTKPDAGNFPRRNRIISGIALGTLIVETGIEGGAMITASMALDQNREVFAIPTAVNERKSSGTNLLIKQGKAMLTESVEDILAELAPRLKRFLSPAGESAPPPSLSLFEQRLYDTLTEEPLHIDAIAERAACATSDALVHLLSLEFKGVVRQNAGKMFLRI
jgi:DNA processing protein